VGRIEPTTADMVRRRSSFVEVEHGFTAEQARCEARRCLRCDLEFTMPADETATAQMEGELR
jgi:hypothetical protein